MTVQPIAGGITRRARIPRRRRERRDQGVRRARRRADRARRGRPPAAALFTTNQVQAAPVTVSREHLAASGGRVAAVLVNSGCANACTGADGLRVARESAAGARGRASGCPPDQVLVASTGVIGVALSLDKVRSGHRACARRARRPTGTRRRWPS